MAEITHGDRNPERYQDPSGEVNLCSFCQFGCRQVVRNRADDWRTDEKMEQYLCHSPAIMGVRSATPRFVLDFVYECDGFIASIVVQKVKSESVQLPVQVQEAVREQLSAQTPPPAPQPSAQTPPPPCPAPKKGKKP
jgi:hypothetical protein